MLDLSSLDLEEIAAALADQTDYEHRWLINPQTGQVVLWTSDTGIDGQTPVDVDDLDLIGIDPLPSYVWYQDMAEFAERASDTKPDAGWREPLRARAPFVVSKTCCTKNIRTCCRRGTPSARPAANAARSTGSSTTRSSTTTQPPGFSTTTPILTCHNSQRSLRPTILTATSAHICRVESVGLDARSCR